MDRRSIPQRFVGDRPCLAERNGRRFDEFCGECPHALLVHREDMTCELCAIRREALADG